MALYRIILYGADRIIDGPALEADDDYNAIAITKLVSEMCSDACTRIELWAIVNGSPLRQLKMPPDPPIKAHEITQQMQERAIETEEHLWDSHRALLVSRQRLDQLKKGPNIR